MSLPSNEQWRPVPGWPDYQVSNLGRVKSPRGLILAGTLAHLGRATPYRQVGLTDHGHKVTFKVHRLVALAWLPEPASPDMQVRHLDGDSLNNVATNLAWGTQGDNERDKVRHGRHRNAQKTHCKRGHEFTPENTLVDEARGQRNCRACRTERHARTYRPRPRRASEAPNVPARGTAGNRRALTARADGPSATDN